MNLKKERRSAETIYRVDWPRRGYTNYYGSIWHSRAEAQAYIDNRNPKYKDELEIVAQEFPSHDRGQYRVCRWRRLLERDGGDTMLIGRSVSARRGSVVGS